jgi:hypothetical protein
MMHRVVIAGLDDPAISLRLATLSEIERDGRDKRGHDEEGRST